MWSLKIKYKTYPVCDMSSALAKTLKLSPSAPSALKVQDNKR